YIPPPTTPHSPHLSLHDALPISLRDVTKEIAEEYAGHLNHGRLSPSTFNKHLNVLTLIFRVVKQKAKLAGNPWEEIQRKHVVPRSEEHTSELQSRVDIVCRLLLE